jgi:acetyl esterase/lipase
MVTAKDPKDPNRSLRRKTSKRRIHHRHSAQSVVVSLASRLIVKNAVRAWALQPYLRWPLEYVDGMAGLLPRLRSSAEIEPIQLEHCSAEWVRARRASSARAILYLHGGAFLTCGLNTHRSVVCRLSKAADAGVLTVGYRKLPSHQIADAIEDGMSGLRWLQERGYTDDQIVVAGDSAGGYLAFMTTLAAIRTELAKPAGIATISPFTDPDPARKLKHRNALPPVAIHASSDELLLPDAELMAKRLEAAGIRCDLHLWDGQIHDFPLAAEILPEGRQAIRYIGDFVKDVTTGPGSAWNAPLTAAAG